jgi:hypothetical protein
LYRSNRKSALSYAEALLSLISDDELTKGRSYLPRSEKTDIPGQESVRSVGHLRMTALR